MRLKSATGLENLFGILKETLTFQPPSYSYLEGEQIIGFEFLTHILSSQFLILELFWLDIENSKSKIKAQFESPNLEWTLAALRRRPQMPQISF